MSLFDEGPPIAGLAGESQHDLAAEVVRLTDERDEAVARLRVALVTVEQVENALLDFQGRIPSLASQLREQREELAKLFDNLSRPAG